MSVYVVRNSVSGLFLHKQGLCGTVAEFKHAEVFRSKEDARREVQKYESWRELVEVWWRVCWFEHGERKPIGNKVERVSFESSREARASVYYRLLYGSGGSGDEVGFKVVRVLRVVKS